MKKLFNFFAVFSILMVFFTGCDNFLNSNEDFINLMETEINYARAPLVNVLVGHNNDYYGTVGSGVVNYSVTAKVGFAFEVSFTLKSSAGNFTGWNAYTKYDPDIPANCKLLDPSFIEFMDNSRDKLTAKVKILRETNEQIRLVPEVSAFPIMEVSLPAELMGITPVPVTFNPTQAIKALTPGQEYSITATTTVDYGYSANAEECWKVYRKDTLGNEIEIVNDNNITISKNPGTQLANGRSQSTIYITVGSEFSGRFFVSPRLITYPSMKVEIENFDSSLVKMSHSGTVSMAKGTPYEITLQTDPSVGFSGWKLCKKNNATLREIEELFPADKKTTTNISAFTTYSDEFIEVSSPTYDVSETGKTAGKVTASIKVTLKEDMDDLEYSYYLLPEFFKYPVVNVYSPDGYGFAGRISLTGAGFLDNDSVRMMMDDYEYTLTYKTNEDYSFAEPYWIVYETANPSQNLLDVEDARIELLKSSIVTDESGASSCSLSLTLKHNFETNLNIKPVVAQKPSMNISFDENVPSGINLSLGGNTITSGSVNSKSIKIVTGKTYTATVNIPKGYSFEGWKLVREISSADKLNWITESTKSTTDIIENASLEFDSAALAESPDNFVKLFNAKYDFELEGRNAGNTKATIDLLIKAELSDFSLHLVPVVKIVPEISFAPVNSDYGTFSPLSSDVRNLYPETKIDLTFKSTKQATVGKEIWKIKKWNPGTGSYSIDYSANVGYTSLDLTAALKDDELKTKNIIIYNNDTETEVQANSKGEYITAKKAVLYVNIMPDANLMLSVTPIVYSTISFAPKTAAEGSVSPSEERAIIIGEDYNISFISTGAYGFDKWSVTNGGSAVPVLSLAEASGAAGTSAALFVVDLGSVQELSGTNTVANIQSILGSNKSKLLAVVYNTSIVESQSTEGVETVTAKFRIVKDTTSAIVVNPVTYKHSYFYLHLANSADGRFSPASRTLMKAGKDYDIEYIFNGTTYTIYPFQASSDSSFARGTSYTISDFIQLSQSSITDWSTYSSKKFVIYGISNSITESNNVATRKAKIRLIKELTDGIEIHIRPSVDNIQKISFTADTSDISKLQINNTISTTGSIDSYPVIEHNILPYKSYSISATPVNGKAVYSEPGKMWKILNEDGDDLNEIYDCATFTTGSYDDDMIRDYDIVFYNSRLEYVGNNLYKACADIIIKKDQIPGDFKIIPQVYTIPDFKFNAPVTTVGNEKKGTCLVDGVVPQSNSKLLVGQTYEFSYEATEGYHISTFGLYDNSGVSKKVFSKTVASYADTNIKIAEVSFSADLKTVSGKLSLLKDSANGYSFKCNVEQGKPGPTLNIGSSKTYLKYDPVTYIYNNSAGNITQYNNEVDTDYIILTSQEFNLSKAQERGYQGETDSESIAGYPIAKTGSIRFYLNASTDGNYTPSKIKITERLFYLHPGMLMDYSRTHDYSDYDVIGAGGMQLFDEVGNYIADSKYKNAAFNLEETTILNASSLTGYTNSSYTISGYTAYSNKISYGGIHQYTVSVLDNEGNESNKFVVYLDVPRTPRTNKEKQYIIDSKSYVSNETTGNINSSGFIIEWPASDYPEGNIPLNDNFRIVYSAGEMKASTTECIKRLYSNGRFSNYSTGLRIYPSNTNFKFKIYISDSNGYATEAIETEEYTSAKVRVSDLVVRDSETSKFYYISLETYLRNKNRLEPVAIVTHPAFNLTNNRIVCAGLFDVGDYSFTNQIVYYKQSQSYSVDGRVQMQAWKTNAPYYSSASATKGTIPFTELYFPALYKATHYGDIFKPKFGTLSTGWYLPSVNEMYGFRTQDDFMNINRVLEAIDAQPFEYNSSYWCAEYMEPDAVGPRNKVLKTLENNYVAKIGETFDFAYSTEVHHVRAVFDFTDLAEPWPNN